MRSTDRPPSIKTQFLDPARQARPERKNRVCLQRGHGRFAVGESLALEPHPCRRAQTEMEAEIFKARALTLNEGGVAHPGRARAIKKFPGGPGGAGALDRKAPDSIR